MSKLSNREKEDIREALRRYAAKFPSQNKAARSLAGVSAATLSTILAGRFESVSDDMLRGLAAQVGAAPGAEGWQVVETAALQEMALAFEDAQRWKNVTWVVGEAGCGKTTAARLWAREHAEVFYVLCSEDMHRGDFVREIARRTGVPAEGHSIREAWGLILDELVRMDAPLLIFDEADKLAEPVFHYFISLYNRVEEHAGIVFLSTDYICERVRRGLQYRKPGYKEFYSRIGRKFFELEATTAEAVAAVCRANGLGSPTDVEAVVREAGRYDYDLRRVRKTVHRIRRTKHGEQ